MAYYSNVKIIIAENEVIDIKQVARQAIAIEDVGDIEYGYNDDKIKVLEVTYQGVKWYDDIELVNYWKNIIKKLKDENKDKYFLYTKQGEEWDDIEIEGDYGYVNIITELDYDVDIEYY